MPANSIHKIIKPQDFAFIVFADHNQNFKSKGSERFCFMIIEGAIAAFNKHGLQSASLAQVARACGVKESTIKYHFGSLKNLKLQTMKYCRVLYQSYVIRKMLGGKNRIQQFDFYLEACMEWPRLFKKHCQFWLHLLAESVSDEDIRILNTESTSGGRLRLINFIDSGIKEKIFHTENAEVAGKTIHLLVTGYLFSAMTQDEFPGLDELRNNCYSILGLQTQIRKS